MSWNNQKVEDLKKLWNEGVATSQIGVQLGFTKNAVIGKAFRLGLERRQNSRKKSNQNHNQNEQSFFLHVHQRLFFQLLQYQFFALK